MLGNRMGISKGWWGWQSRVQRKIRPCGSCLLPVMLDAELLSAPHPAQPRQAQAFESQLLMTSGHPSPPGPSLQLMSMILIMVMTKKGRASICTFTRIAVTRNTSRMATRLPRIRTD